MKDSIHTWLTEQFGDDAELHAELYGQYAADMRNYLAKASGALNANLATVAAAAHTMKGMALQMGDTEISEVCKALQLEGQSSHAPTCADLISQLSELVAAL